MEKDVRFYQRQLSLADKEEKKWRERAKKIVKKYRDEDPKGSARYNILWSNTQTQFPALYSSRPKPDVRRRWRSDSRVGRDIAQAVERALEFSMDSYDFDRMGEKLTLDFLLPGRMVARVKYHPVIETREITEIGFEEAEGAEPQDDGTFLTKREFSEVVHEEVRAYHVPWKHYRQSPADCWNDVWWVAYGDHFLTKEEIIEQFGAEHDDVPLNFSDTEEYDDEHSDKAVKRAQVWEIWDKEARKVVAVIKGYDRFLMEEDDPLKLQNFFPQPEPALMIESSESLIPIPEYTMYQYQAEELNDISKRLAALVNAMQAKGFYPGEDAAKINELLSSGENVLVPVDNYAAYAEKGGIKGMIDWMPIREIAEVWQRLLVQRQSLTQSIFELIGISDIQRGATDPRETKGAQQLKANFAGRRLLPKQQRTQRFFRDILRIKAEIIAEHFSAKTLTQMTGTPVTDEMRAIMRADALRNFTIDVETDSTIAPDDQLEKQGVAEFLSSLSQYLAQVMPIVQAQPAAVEPLGKMLLWMSRKFKIARDVEQEIEDFIQAFKTAPRTDSDAKDAEAQAKMQLQAKELEVKMQIAQAEAQAKQSEAAQKIQLQQQQAAAELELKKQQMIAEQEHKLRELQAEEERKNRELSADIERKNLLLEVELRERGLSEAKVDRELRILDAKISKERGKNIVPISAAFRVTRDESGKITGAEMEGDTGNKVLRLDSEDGKVTGGKIVS